MKECINAETIELHGTYNYTGTVRLASSTRLKFSHMNPLHGVTSLSLIKHTDRHFAGALQLINDVIYFIINRYSF